MVKRVIVTVVLLAILALLVLSAESEAQAGLTPPHIVDSKFSYGQWGPYGIRVHLWTDVNQKSTWVTNSLPLWEYVKVGQLCEWETDEFGLGFNAACRWPTFYYLPSIIKPHY